jgi:hypothetical protein
MFLNPFLPSWRQVAVAIGIGILLGLVAITLAVVYLPHDRLCPCPKAPEARAD